MSGWICPCGKSNGDGVHSCSACGNAPFQRPEQRSKFGVFLGWLLVFGIAVVAVLLVGAVYSRVMTTPDSATAPAKDDHSSPVTMEQKAESAPPGYPYFSDGTHVVGQDVGPGTYRTRTGLPGCYYARLAGFSGESRDIIANENTNAPAVITISPNDKGFVSRGCGLWTEDLSSITSSRTSFGDGAYIIGTDIQPGTYRNNGQQRCYYERLSGFGGVSGETIANENTNSSAVVTISPTDSGFKSARCGTWNLIGEQ